MTQVERPRTEPEIIPPGRSQKPYHDGRLKHVYVVKVSPLGAVFSLVITAILTAVLLVMLLATILVWLPLVAAFAFGAIIAGLLRSYFGGRY
jgi:hypothetical protein